MIDTVILIETADGADVIGVTENGLYIHNRYTDRIQAEEMYIFLVEDAESDDET